METNQHLQQIKRSYIREILSAAKSPDVISLAGGLPASDLMPIHLFIEAMQSLECLPEVFQYGETQGYGPLLDYIQRNFHLSETTQSVVCNGSQQGLDLIARTFLNPGDIVAMEAPSYLGALQVFGLAGAEVVTISQNSSGPDLDALEALFQCKPVKCFYAVPDFHNPTGVCWSLTVRQAVAELCQRYAVTFIEDAPYRELRFNGEHLPTVASFCVEQSIVLRSFSKVCVPSVRLGVVSAKHDFIAPILKVKQAADLHTGTPMQAALLHVLEQPEFSSHLQQLRQQYHARAAVLGDALKPLVKLGCSYEHPNGGMFIWLKLPKNFHAMVLAEQLLKQDIAVVPSDVFYSDESQVEAALRLNFSHCSEPQLKQASGVIQDAIETAHFSAA